jgi:hypothetical protein
MRTPSDQSMMRAVALGLALLALACTDSKAVAPSTPSPLLAMDEDRLWILLWARGDMEPRCWKVFGETELHRDQDFQARCARWEVNALEMLRANDIVAQEEHLRDQQFWNWYTQKAAAISKCSAEALRREGLSGSKRQLASISCDPHEKLTRVDKKRVEDMGIRIP